MERQQPLELVSPKARPQHTSSSSSSSVVALLSSSLRWRGTKRRWFQRLWSTQSQYRMLGVVVGMTSASLFLWVSVIQNQSSSESSALHRHHRHLSEQHHPHHHHRRRHHRHHARALSTSDNSNATTQLFFASLFSGGSSQSSSSSSQPSTVSMISMASVLASGLVVALYSTIALGAYQRLVSETNDRHHKTKSTMSQTRRRGRRREEKEKPIEVETLPPYYRTSSGGKPQCPERQGRTQYEWLLSVALGYGMTCVIFWATTANVTKLY